MTLPKTRTLLNLKDEINALSSLLLMRDLEPPMAVGISRWLGRWQVLYHALNAGSDDGDS